MEREKKHTNRFEDLDLTKPLKVDDIMVNIAPEDCFGKAWDLRTTECSMCGERDTCGIVYNSKVVVPKVQEVQEEQGAIFLDLTDFQAITADSIFKWVNSGETTPRELVAYVMALAQTSDKEAAVQYLKRFVRDTEGITVKNKLVWLS